MTTVYDVAASELEETLRSWGEPAYRVRQVSDALWRRGATYEEMTELPGALRERLAATFPLGIEVVEERLADRGATRKALLRLDGRHLVEAVLMGYPDRVTVCISSQAGCGMGCGFCATGQMGLLGNLTAGQIAAQVLWARREAARLPASTPRRLGNVVFMGMGEPLANEKQVFAAIARITDPAGIRLGARHITVSTVGLVPGIRNLATAHPQVGLAVSLHAADDATRTRLVPINRRYPLAELEEARLGIFGLALARDETGLEERLPRGLETHLLLHVRLQHATRGVHTHEQHHFTLFVGQHHERPFHIHQLQGLTLRGPHGNNR